ncbi:MAG TPA: acyl-CoA dehydrogenase family protein, partial [Polyangiaceae bacterium]|nr:acyl-CoA dehydrogenase family protein [Polyangiaceae bacterium]
MTNPLADLKSLVERIDLKRIATIAKHVDLPKLIGVFAQLEPEDLAHLASLARARHGKKPLPEPHGDFYGLGELLEPDEMEIKLRVRDFMRQEVAPIVNQYWLRGEFPKQVIPGFAALDVAGLTFQGYGFPGRSWVLEGLIAEEIARVDVSMSTFFGVQAG